MRLIRIIGSIHTPIHLYTSQRAALCVIPRSQSRMSNRRSRPNDSPEVKLSKFLSYILRHGATKEGLALRDDGSIEVAELMKHKKLHNTDFETIKHVVDTNDKKRYELFEENKQWFIRASQGHSIKIKEPPLTKLTESTMPKVIVHGTRRENIRSIEEKGLMCMNRTHIHFATGTGDDVVSGIRKTSNAFVYINIELAVRDGIEFYVSQNGVVLSKGVNGSGVIPAMYFDRIVVA